MLRFNKAVVENLAENLLRENLHEKLVDKCVKNYESDKSEVGLSLWTLG